MMKRITNSLMIIAVLALVVGFFTGDVLAQSDDGCTTKTDGKCTDKKSCGTSCSAKGEGECCGTCDSGGDCTGDCKGAVSCPFSQCVVSGKKFDGTAKPVLVNYEGRQIYLFDAKCRTAFEADPKPYVKKYDQAMINVQSKMYPLDTCIVTGTKFSAEKPPVDYLYNNRLVRFCCPSLIAKFKENPAKYMAALDKAVVEQQTARYPLDTCVVTGQKLGSMGKSHNYVWANQLVKFCCKGCIPQFNKDPRNYMVKVYAAMPQHGQDTGSTSTVAPALKSKKGCGSDCGSSCGDKDTGTSTVVPASKSKKGCGSSCGSKGSCGDKDSGTSTVVPAAKTKKKSCGSSCGSGCGGK